VRIGELVTETAGISVVGMRVDAVAAQEAHDHVGVEVFRLHQVGHVLMVLVRHVSDRGVELMVFRCGKAAPGARRQCVELMGCHSMLPHRVTGSAGACNAGRAAVFL